MLDLSRNNSYSFIEAGTTWTPCCRAVDVTNGFLVAAKNLIRYADIV